MNNNNGKLTEDERAKWRYTYMLFWAMMGWAAGLIWFVYRAFTSGLTQDIIGVSGTGIVLGALVTKWSDAHQFWFRKPKPTDTAGDQTGKTS